MVQLIEDVRQDQGAGEHPLGPEEPQHHRHGQVIGPHAQGVMHHAQIQGVGDEFRVQHGVAFKGHVDHEIHLVEIADGQGETEKGEEEVDDEHHDFDQKKGLDAGEDDRNVEGYLSDVIRFEEKAEQAQADKHGGGSQEAGSHGPVAQGLHRQDVPPLGHDGLHPHAAQVPGEAHVGLHGGPADLVEPVDMV